MSQSGSQHVKGTAPGGSRWWPLQLAPKAVVHAEVEADLGITHTLVQSAAGLAAQAVNEGRSDEMVWIGTGGRTDYARWYDGLVTRLGFEGRGRLGPWELVGRLKDQGIVEGYVLYRYDDSKGDLYTTRSNMDQSINVATSVAGLLKGVLVEETQEAQAQALGLDMLFDARGRDMLWCFETYRNQLNRNLLCTQDPKVPHIRDMAIAHRAFAVYGTGEPVPAISAWLEPLSPMLGWNSGDEFAFTILPSLYGHFNTATNWCLNLPLLSAGTEGYRVRRFANLDPATINFEETRHAMAFVMSDGDNVQWLMDGFCIGSEFWESPDHGRFPFGWTACTPNLMQLCPETVDYLSETQPAQTSMLSGPGGYYYPDRFGELRAESDLLARHARQVAAHMAENGAKILWFICHNLQSPAAFAAYDTYAREIDGLLGMFAIQYTPYEGGAGEIFWTQDRNGVNIPVVTARYSLWANATTGNRSGEPEHIAQVINEGVARAEAQEKSTCEWAIVHAWSYFKPSPDADLSYRGVTPVGWCIERLAPMVKVVSPEELLWRIRMEYYPEQTRQIIDLIAGRS